MAEEIKRNCDAVYGILEAWEKRHRVVNKVHHNTLKLLERMELDRPILQREKFELLMMEKQLDGDDAGAKQSPQQMNTYQIRQKFAYRMKARKNHNRQQLLAYKKL